MPFCVCIVVRASKFEPSSFAQFRVCVRTMITEHRKTQRSEMFTTSEEYLIIIGRSVRKEADKKPGILFHAYIFAYNRRVAGPIERHLAQALER